MIAPETAHSTGDASRRCALTFVIPLYYSAETLRPVVREIEALEIAGGHELVLVNDGSRDGTAEVCRELLATARVPMVYIEHARNFGEHNAVLTGYRYAQGDYVINLDDDGQNPPAEGARLYEEARRRGLDVVYGHYSKKEHAGWRNLGSRFCNAITDWLLDKPSGFYLSSFRCVSGLVAKEAASHAGPFPYVDGLILQVTQSIGSLEVKHEKRTAGQSGYNLRRLIRLWLSTVVNFSVMPLRLATLMGMLLAAGGLFGITIVVYLRLSEAGPAFGWGSLMAAMLLFSGVQLLMLGIIGEYVGRMFLAVNQRPQSVVRVVTRSG